MQVERIEEIRLSYDDEMQIGALLDCAFGSDGEGRSYYQQRHHVRLIMREESKILGHFALSLRAVCMSKQIVQVVGLADVGTDPHHRGKGNATKLMAAAIQEARASVASFIEVRTAPTKEVAKEGLMILPLTDLAWDDDAIIDLAGHAF